MTLQNQLRQAIEASGESIYRIAQRSGVADQVVRRFATGQRDNLTLETASKIAGVFGMRLTAPRRAKAQKEA